MDEINKQFKPVAFLREPAAVADSPAARLDQAARTGGAIGPELCLSVLGVGEKVAAELLAKFPAGSLASAPLLDLKNICGAAAGRRVFAALALAQNLMPRKASTYLKPRDIFEELRDLRAQKKEHFVVFFLDTRNQEIKREIVSIGTLNYNLVHPREVFEPAVRNLAASVIVAHNHPSGCLEPSDEDLALTKRLTQAGKLLGIEVLDHVIVAHTGFMSFKEKGLI